MEAKRSPLTKIAHGLECRGVAEVKVKGESIEIEGLANKVVIDRGQDIINADAWDLENYKKNPVILYNHGMDPQLGGTPIGKATMIKPTEEGLYVRVKLASIDDPMINRIRGLVKERILRAFSVGFDPKKQDTDPETNVNTITEAELYEISIVGVPMNQDSLFELSGKMLKSKSIDAIKKDVLKEKGAWVAAAVHNQIYAMQEAGGDRDAILSSIAESADISLDELMDVLAGNTTPVPESILAALAEGLDLSLDDLKELDQADMQVGKASEQAEEESEEESEEIDEAGMDSEEEEEDKGDMPKDEDEEKREHDEDDDEEKSEKSFQECVAEKIPKLIGEGMEQDQAIAVAIEMCSDKSNPQKRLKDDYMTWFDIAEKAEIAIKQESDTPTSTISANNTETENNDFGNPSLEAQKQTNVLLGALINEIQLMSSKIDQLMPASESSEDQSESSVEAASTESESSEESSEKSAQVELDEYAKKLETIKKRLDSLTV